MGLWRMDRRRRVNLKVLTYYGNGKLACVWCGFTDIRALSIDHINGGGSKHRQVISNRWSCDYLRSEGFPMGYQTLCMNCQFIKKVAGREL